MDENRTCDFCRGRGITRLAYKIVAGIQMCGGCVADMPTYCTLCISEKPPRYTKPVAFRDGRLLCDEHLQKLVPKPVPTLAQIANEHFEEPKPKSKQEAVMTKQIDWDAAQIDRDAGMTTTALAEKYEVSVPTVCNHTKPAKDGAGKQTKPVKMGGTQPANGRPPNYAEVIADLRAKRDAIDLTIGMLEKLS